MSRLVNDGVSYVIVRDKALTLVSGPYAQGMGDVVRGLRRFIQQHITLVGEPEEMLTHPARMLRDIELQGRAFGDCDDVSILGAALLASLGFSTRFVAAFPRQDGTFAHVFLQYKYPGSDIWRPLDLTISGIPVYSGETMISEN